jgi:hypothetical protein
MNRRFGLTVLSAVLFLVTLSAQAADWAILVGKWKLNTAKSQFNNVPPRPKVAVMVISEATASHFKWQATFTSSNGDRSVMGFDGAIDGKPYVYKGAEHGARLAFVENNAVLEGVATYSGGGTIHQAITVSPDGNTMTAQCSLSFPSETASWVEVWEREPDKNRK